MAFYKLIEQNKERRKRWEYASSYFREIKIRSCRKSYFATAFLLFVNGKKPPYLIRFQDKKQCSLLVP